MNDKSDQPTGTPSWLGARACLCLAVTLQFVRVTLAADLYVDAAATNGGDGSSNNPYARITDSLERARSLRQDALIAPGETIVIHVAPGVYLGSKEPSVLARNPRYEMLPLLLNVPNLELAGSTTLTLDVHGLPALYQFVTTSTSAWDAVERTSTGSSETRTRHLGHSPSQPSAGRGAPH